MDKTVPLLVQEPSPTWSGWGLGGARRHLVAAGLQGEQLGVATIDGDQLGVDALLGDAALVHDVDPVDVPHVREPVADQNRRLSRNSGVPVLRAPARRRR
jgi:hypothetical protein